MVDPAAYAVKLGWQSTQWQLPLRVYSVEKLDRSRPLSGRSRQLGPVGGPGIDSRQRL